MGRLEHDLQAHKPGRHASAGARARKAKGKFDAPIKSAASTARRGKEARMQAAASARSKSRAEAMERRRHTHAPLVIQVLSLSAELDHQPLWCAHGLHRSTQDRAWNCKACMTTRVLHLRCNTGALLAVVQGLADQCVQHWL